MSIPGAHNLRDLGGLRSSTGERLRRGLVYRSDYPLFAEIDRLSVQGLGLRTVVDLRRGAEVATEVIPWEGLGVRWVRWPLSAGAATSWEAGYANYLEHRPETVVGAVREVMRSAESGVLFHCAAGKDRTGVIAALLLQVLGVTTEVIVEDYLLSATSVVAILGRLRRHHTYEVMLAATDDERQQPTATTMHQFLEWLREHGGAASWLTARGVPVSEIERFRSLLLDDEGGAPCLA